MHRIVTATICFFLIAVPALAQLERVDGITLETGEDYLVSALVDPSGEFAYFGTNLTAPGRIVKIDLETFERVDVLSLQASETDLYAGIISPDGAYAYFGTFTVPARVIKVDLETFERVDAITLDVNFIYPSAIVDPEGNFAYFGTWTSPGQVVKINLESFEHVETITFEEEESTLGSAVIAPDGDFAYFGTVGTAEPSTVGRVVKVDLNTFERVDAITFEEGEILLSGVIDPAGEFAYFGTGTEPGRVVKVDLESFERVDAITFEEGENNAYSAVISPDGAFAIFGMAFTSPARVVKVGLDTFERVEGITLDVGENDVTKAAAIDPEGEFAYLGTWTEPGRVVKVGLGSEVATEGRPQQGFHLSNAAPNPATGSSSFALRVADVQHVTAEVFDITGRSVKTLYDGTLAGGTSKTLTLDTSRLPPGVYVIRATGEDFFETRRVTVVR